jgi:hypothetical protein
MPDEPASPDEPIERPIREYIANGAAEGAMSAAQRLSEAIGVGLDEVLAAVQRLGPWEPTANLAGEGSLTAGGSVRIPAMAVAGTVFVSDADAGSAAEGFSVVRQADVEKLSAQASRGGLLARLSANQRILVAVVLIAAVYPVLPPELQKALLDEAALTAALAAVLTLLKR